MKFSLCSVGCKQEPIEEIVRKAADIGYEGLEVWNGHAVGYREQYGELGSLRELAAKYGIRPTVIAGYTAFLTSGRSGTEASAVEQIGPLIADAAELNAPYVRVFLDWIGSDEAAPEHWDKAVLGLQAAAGEAARSGVTLIMETHQNQLTDTTATTLRLIEAANHEQIRVNLDIYNLFERGEDPLAAAEALLPVAVNVHLKNGQKDPGGKVRYGVPLKEGNMNYLPFLRYLLDSRYTGYAAVEWFGDAFWEAAEHELAWLRQVNKRFV